MVKLIFLNFQQSFHQIIYNNSKLLYFFSRELALTRVYVLLLLLLFFFQKKTQNKTKTKQQMYSQLCVSFKYILKNEKILTTHVYKFLIII